MTMDYVPLNPRISLTPLGDVGGEFAYDMNRIRQAGARLLAISAGWQLPDIEQETIDVLGFNPALWSDL